MMVAPCPIPAHERRYGEVLPAGIGCSRILADFDFETYSPAGYEWDEESCSYVMPKGANKKGLMLVGMEPYSAHPDAEVLCLAYNLKDGLGVRTWHPHSPLPYDLFDHLSSGKLLEAWNVSFEFWVWNNICVPKYGFPPLLADSVRCAMAKARAFNLPGALGKAALALGSTQQKDKRGESLISMFCVPRKPTKADSSPRNLPYDHIEAFHQLVDYCKQDVLTEADVSALIPDLSPFELKFWKLDQVINARGVLIDVEVASKAITLISELSADMTQELSTITHGQITSHAQTKRLLEWMLENDVESESVDAKSVAKLLKQDLSPTVKDVLKIRAYLAGSSVKKFYTMIYTASADHRLRNLFIYHGCRTGRASGQKVQPQNLPNSGPLEVWEHKHVEECIDDLMTLDKDQFVAKWPTPLEALSGCLRGMFRASEGKVLICSDYSAIEAVVLAELAGEEWRQEVFRTHGLIYEMSASKITGVPFEDFVRHKEETKQHHPYRKTIGKVAELASGYQGGLGAWKRFGADAFFTDEEIQKAVKQWRASSPNIVKFWGGQKLGWESKLFGVEGHFIKALQNPRQFFTFRGLTFYYSGDILYITLLSGRNMVYHEPRLDPHPQGWDSWQISYMGWKSSGAKGQAGWVRINTYGGSLVENIVQATARDILAHAIVNLEEAGFPVVLHVHDEIVCEIDESKEGALVEIEKIMSTMPAWAKGWPVKATGGWVNKRYGK